MFRGGGGRSSGLGATGVLAGAALRYQGQPQARAVQAGRLAHFCRAAPTLTLGLLSMLISMAVGIEGKAQLAGSSPCWAMAGQHSLWLVGAGSYGCAGRPTGGSAFNSLAGPEHAYACSAAASPARCFCVMPTSKSLLSIPNMRPSLGGNFCGSGPAKQSAQARLTVLLPAHALKAGLLERGKAPLPLVTAGVDSVGIEV